MNKILNLANIQKSYHTKEGEIVAIKDINLDILKGEIVAIVGPSGCGKSTLLSIISNLEQDYCGKILKDDKIKMSYM